MAKLEIIYAKDDESGNSRYHIGSYDSNGTLTIVDPKLRKHHRALTILAELSGKKDTSDAPKYKNMTKKELEETMRTHGIELDRRKSKSVLLKEVETFFGAK